MSEDERPPLPVRTPLPIHDYEWQHLWRWMQNIGEGRFFERCACGAEREGWTL